MSLCKISKNVDVSNDKTSMYIITGEFFDFSLFTLLYIHNYCAIVKVCITTTLYRENCEGFLLRVRTND
jgi:hypothetical protein